jgi:HD-GYP domain-containing protein (c-di-GMP phosphodiesterase class II)
MRTHCVHGYQLVKKIPFLAEAAEIVYAHHEKFDGTGYPRGLKGERIPLGARIISVADALDTITSDRPYRTARSLHEARKEIEHYSVRQFDPSVVETFLRIPDKNWLDLRDTIESARNS